MRAHDISSEELDVIVDSALAEDGFGRDSTVSVLDLDSTTVSARILARAAGVVAGLDIAVRVFQRAGATAVVDREVQDGASVVAGDRIATVRAGAAVILGAERVALNFLQRLSGIATLTARFVERLRGSGIEVLDTRKTTPLLRKLERYAVRAGGGKNHRFNLSDMILIKENHFRAAGGAGAVRAALSRRRPTVPVEVEVDSPAFLRAMLGASIDRIMLDNFAPDQIVAAISEIKAYQKDHPSFAPEIEASGGINLDNIGDYAIAGLDFVSIGALTHSAPALDISLEVTDD